MRGAGARVLALGLLAAVATGCAGPDDRPSADPSEAPAVQATPSQKASPSAAPTPAPTPEHISAPASSTPSSATAVPSPTRPARPSATARTAGSSLAGLRVVIDPGHQLGNARFRTQINRIVDAGGLRKACNTTGTATNTGVSEATMAWQVSTALRDALTERGATVVLTRDSNSRDAWGPCVDRRGRAGAQGQVLISLHGDGNTSAGARGFHVIVPSGGAAPVAASARLGADLRDGLVSAGLTPTNYLSSDRGIVRRSDLGTLNLSPVPSVMVELGNMRDADDADLLTTRRGQRTIVGGLTRGLEGWVAQRER